MRLLHPRDVLWWCGANIDTRMGDLDCCDVSTGRIDSKRNLFYPARFVKMSGRSNPVATWFGVYTLGATTYWITVEVR